VDPDSVAVTAELDAIAGAAYCLAADSTGKLLVGGASGQLKLLSSLASASPDAAAEDSVAEDSVAESSSASQPGFKAVELLRDQWGIPHVFAATDEGAMYGLGYASAEDRGFQMHYNLRQIQGRMAEVFGNRPMTAGGESTLHMDRRMRTIGYYRSATAVAQKLDKRTKSLLAAYCQGVNHWFAQHPERAHPFFEKFGLEREPWTPADCIASHWFLGQFFAGDGLDELANRRANLAGAPGPPAANFIVDEAASIVKRKDVSDNWVKAVESYAATLKLPQPVPAAHDGPKFSHAWVVGGSRTTSGKSVLVGDPQTPILNPSLFYEFHVCGDTINSRGIAAPGTPGIMIGWTEHFAWSVTALGADQADLFRLETDRDHPNQYKLDGVWRDMQLHREKIFVKDGSPEELTVRLTHFGPVVSSIADRLDSEAEVALRRVPLSITDSETIQGFFGMMTAKTMPEFTQALAYWSFPSTNLVFGNRDGDIGYWLQAGIPARPSADDKHHGQATADGSLSSNDWRGLVPHALLPHVINPSDGWIASGNHRAIESFYPIRTGVGKGSNGHSIRSFRLYERLAEKAKFQSRDVLDMHFDMTNPGRRIVVRAGLHLRDQQRAQLSQEAQLAIDELRPWHAAGAKLDLGQRGAALAGQIPLEFRTHVTPLAEEFGGGQGGLVKWLRDIDQRLDQGPAVVLSEAEVRFVDGALAAGWKKSQAAFGADPAQWNRRASAESQKQMRGYMNHMNNLGSLDTAYDLPTPELFCIDGTTIRSQGSQAYTQYVPFDDLDRAQSLLPPGNSERPDSPWRTATAEIWARGELHPAPLSRSAVEQISTLKIKLN
jgi:penicillin amidase